MTMAYVNPLRTTQTPVVISGLWLRREGRHAVVLVERDGRWHEVIREPLDAQFSCIVEPNGIRKIAP